VNRRLPGAPRSVLLFSCCFPLLSLSSTTSYPLSSPVCRPSLSVNVCCCKLQTASIHSHSGFHLSLVERGMEHETSHLLGIFSYGPAAAQNPPIFTPHGWTWATVQDSRCRQLHPPLSLSSLVAASCRLWDAGIGRAGLLVGCTFFFNSLLP
jgi:hypothetical protein